MTINRGSPAWFKEMYEQRFAYTNQFQGTSTQNFNKFKSFVKTNVKEEFSDIKEFTSRSIKEGYYTIITGINTKTKKQEYLGFIHPTTKKYHLGSPYLLPVYDSLSNNIELIAFADESLEEKIGSRFF